MERQKWIFIFYLFDLAIYDFYLRKGLRRPLKSEELAERCKCLVRHPNQTYSIGDSRSSPHSEKGVRLWSYRSDFTDECC